MTTFPIDFIYNDKTYTANVEKITRVGDITVQFHVLNLPKELNNGEIFIFTYNLKNDKFEQTITTSTELPDAMLSAILFYCTTNNISTAY